MCRELDGIDRAVGDTDVREAVDLEVGVDDTTKVLRQHSAGARRMVFRSDVQAQPSVPLVVGLDGVAGEDLLYGVVFQRFRSTDLAG